MIEIPKLPEYQVVKDDLDEEFDPQANSRNQGEEDATSFDEEDEDFEEKRLRREAMRQQAEDSERSANKKSSQPKVVPPTVNVENPYETDETSYFIPILVAIGAFIPLLFCLCRI